MCCVSNAAKSSRKGRYQLHKLIAKYGRRGNLMKWKEQLNGVLAAALPG